MCIIALDSSPFASLLKFVKHDFVEHAHSRLLQPCRAQLATLMFTFVNLLWEKQKFIATSIGPFTHAPAQFASTQAARYPTSGFKSSLISATLKNRFSVQAPFQLWEKWHNVWQREWKMHPKPTATYSSVNPVFPNLFSLHIPACAMHVLRQAADAQLACPPWQEGKAQAQRPNANGKIVHQPCLSSDSCFAYRSWSQHDEQDEHNKQSHQITECQIWNIRWASQINLGQLVNGQWTWPLFSSLVVQQQR